MTPLPKIGHGGCKAQVAPPRRGGRGWGVFVLAVVGMWGCQSQSAQNASMAVAAAPAMASIGAIDGTSYVAASVSDMASPWRVTVVDIQGHPVAGAEVFIDYNQNGSFGAMPKSVGFTDVRGRIVIPSYMPLFQARREFIRARWRAESGNILFPEKWPAVVVLGRVEREPWNPMMGGVLGDRVNQWPQARVGELRIGGLAGNMQEMMVVQPLVQPNGVGQGRSVNGTCEIAPSGQLRLQNNSVVVPADSVEKPNNQGNP